jgi:hypothetical protein
LDKLPCCLDHSAYGPEGAGVPSSSWSWASNWLTVCISLP